MYRFIEMRVGQFMTAPAVTVAPDLSLRELDQLLATRDFNGLPVVDGGRMVGLVTKFDFLKAFAFTTSQIVPHYDELMQRTVGEVMTTDVISVDPDMRLTRVLELMLSRKARSFPVVSGTTVVGVISREDIMRALKQATASGRRPLDINYVDKKGAIDTDRFATLCRYRLSG
jgi:CBS domain-containing protein